MEGLSLRRWLVARGVVRGKSTVAAPALVMVILAALELALARGSRRCTGLSLRLREARGVDRTDQ